MRVREEHVAQVVTEVSSGAGDPNHVSVVVGTFMQKQPMIGHYVTAHSKDLGLEGTVLTLLHASVVARCVELALGRKLRVLAARHLDAAASSPASGADPLGQEEPELAGYLEGNVTADDATLGGKRRPIALGLLWVITRALLDSA